MDYSSYKDKIRETVIGIAGVGGGGGNAVNYMKEKGIKNVRFMAFNTDFQDLFEKSKAEVQVPLGTLGRGAGANPEIAREAAEQSKKEIAKEIEECDMVFITAGMGGGTGTGASPIIAKIAKDLNKLTVAIVTKPFAFEGNKKKRVALKGIEELKKHVDSIIVIPNEKLFKIGEDTNLTAVQSYKMVNEVLRIGVKTITDLITIQSDVNLDYNDVKAILANSGPAVFGFGIAGEDEDPLKAVEQATENPLLEQSMTGARNVLVNFIINPKFSMSDFNKVSNAIREKLDIMEDEDFIHGLTQDENVKNIELAIIASNFDESVLNNEDIEFNGKEFDIDKDREIYKKLTETTILPSYN